MTTTAAPTNATCDFLDHLFAETPLRNVSVRLWDGKYWPDDLPRAATIVLWHPGALRAMLAAGNAKGLAEAYVRGDFDIDGDIEQALEFALALENRREGWLEALTNYYRLLRLPPGQDRGQSNRKMGGQEEAKHSLLRDRRAIAFHYDVSNDFYSLWLDRWMIYSCAYFEAPTNNLDLAQMGKLRYLCRKLRLRQGQRLLDIGCGWGGLAIFAARHFGVHVTGVTLSEQQAVLATERVRDAGLEKQVTIELRDYREFEAPEPFDAVVSVGMSEHVGRDHLPEYFRKAYSLLRPGGVFLNHAIGEGLRENRFHGPSFVHEHVFPDSDIPPIQKVLAAAAPSGFEVRDVENLREHYTLTLRHWVRRLEAAEVQARRYVDGATYRIWRLYLAGSAHGFNHADLALYQVLFAKPDVNGVTGLSLTRNDWYS